MNKIFKRVWSQSRRAFVTVSEIASSISHNKAKVTALVLGSALSMSAVAGGKLEISSNYSAGALDGYDLIKVLAYNITVNIGSINSPTGNFDSYIYASERKGPSIVINGNTTVGTMSLSGKKLEIKGNLKVNGKVSESDWNQVLYDSKISRGISGFLTVYSSVESGGFVVKGDVTTSAFRSSSGIPPSDNSDLIAPWGATIIEGNLTADYVVTDNVLRFGQGNDYFGVKGTTKISKEFINNGFAQLNKATIARLINGAGYYWGPNDILEYEGRLGSEIAELDSPVIENASLLNVGKFTRTNNVLLTVTGGNVKSTENWFDHSTINISGGLMDASFFGKEQSLGNENTYTVTGGTLATTQLGSGSTVTVSDAGVFKTSTETAFEGFNPVQVGLNVIGFGSDVTQEASEVLTDSFTEFNAGNLKDAFTNVVTFTNGKLLISGANLTQTQASDLEKSFKSKICLLIPQ